MVDDSLNYPLAPLGLLIQDSPHHTSHSVIGWTDFFVFYFLFFCAESKDTRSPASQMSLLQSASLLQPHIRPTTNPHWTNKTRGFTLFAVFSSRDESLLHPVLTRPSNGRRFNPLPNSARAARCISFLLFSAPPSLHLGPLVRCKPPPGFDELNGVVVVMTVNLF